MRREKKNSWFDDSDELCECVACGCDDNHACSGGCSWIAVNLDSMLGLCDACVRGGRAVLMRVHWAEANRPEWIAAAWHQGKEFRTCCVASRRTAAVTNARKMFGPGAQVAELCPTYSIAIAPAKPEPAEPIAAAARGTSSTAPIGAARNAGA